MIYILLAVSCSVFVSVLLKLARRYDIDTRQAIMWNYSMAAFLTLVIYNPILPEFSGILIPAYLSLGILLPTLFVVLALSVQYTGIVKTDIAQRLSLFIPILSSFLVFNEEASPTKVIGIIIAFLAIIFAIPWQKGRNKGSANWLYPATVFVGMGVIDILFKQVAKTLSIPFTSSLLVVFTIALFASLLYVVYLYIDKKLRFFFANAVFGWILGAVNFGNILFYLKAHQLLAAQPSLVFSAMNIGVIILGSVVGVVLFKEKLTGLNYAGIVLAIIAIIVMSLS